jgi:hypothetical protein
MGGGRGRRNTVWWGVGSGSSRGQTLVNSQGDGHSGCLEVAVRHACRFDAAAGATHGITCNFTWLQQQAAPSFFFPQQVSFPLLRPAPPFLRPSFAPTSPQNSPCGGADAHRAELGVVGQLLGHGRDLDTAHSTAQHGTAQHTWHQQSAQHAACNRLELEIHTQTRKNYTQTAALLTTAHCQPYTRAIDYILLTASLTRAPPATHLCGQLLGGTQHQQPRAPGAR